MFGDLESNQSVTLESDDVFIRENVRSIEGDIEIQAFNGLTLAPGGTLSTLSPSGSILLASEGGIIDTSAGELTSLASGEAITIQNAAEVILGNTSAVDGVLTLGTPDNTIGTVVQAAGTTLSVGRVSGVVNEMLDLGQEDNAIDSIGLLTVGGDVRIHDSVGDLQLDELIAAGNVNVSTLGAIEVGEVNAIGQSVTLQGTTINDGFGDLDDSVGDIVARTVSLTATSGIGNVLALELDQVDSIRATSGIGNIDLNSLGASTVVIEQASTSDGSVTLDVAGDVQANAISVTRGDVTLISPGEISVGSIDALTGTITLNGRSIEDLDLDDEGMRVADLSATNVGLTSLEGIGVRQTLELDRVSQLSAVNGMGNVNLESLGLDTLVVDELFTSAGSLALVANGSVVATLVQLGSADQTGTSQTPCSNDANLLDDFEIRIQLNGAASDLEVGEISAFGDSNVFLTVADDITNFGGNSANVIADDLSLVVGNETPDANSGVFLRTRINELVASVAGPNRGDLIIEEFDSICLASSDARVDSIVEVANGKVDVTARDLPRDELTPINTIFVVDNDASMQDADLKGDPEILAADDLNGISPFCQRLASCWARMFKFILAKRMVIPWLPLEQSMGLKIRILTWTNG